MNLCRSLAGQPPPPLPHGRERQLWVAELARFPTVGEVPGTSAWKPSHSRTGRRHVDSRLSHPPPGTPPCWTPEQAVCCCRLAPVAASRLLLLPGAIGLPCGDLSPPSSPRPTQGLHKPSQTLSADSRSCGSGLSYSSKPKPLFEWRVVMWFGHVTPRTNIKKDTKFEEIGLHAQNMITIPNSTVTWFRETYMTIKMSTRIFTSDDAFDVHMNSKNDEKNGCDLISWKNGLANHLILIAWRLGWPWIHGHSSARRWRFGEAHWSHHLCGRMMAPHE